MNAQLALSDEPSFRGRTVTKADEPRLQSQQERVTALMSDGRFRTLAQISALTGYPEASISARLRDAKRPIHGGWTLHRNRVKGHRGLFIYGLSKGGSHALDACILGANEGTTEGSGAEDFQGEAAVCKGQTADS